MTLQKQIKKLEHYEVAHRTAFERFGAVILTVATLMSIIVEHQGVARHEQRHDVTVNSNFIATRPEPAEKNEMVRMPIKFDAGLRATATTGA